MLYTKITKKSQFFLKGSEYMKERYTEKDIQDGHKISEIFSTLSEENKNMAIVYLSALRDKEIADSGKKICEIM